MIKFILKFFFGINYYKLKKIHVIIDFMTKNCYINNRINIQRRNFYE